MHLSVMTNLGMFIYTVKSEGWSTLDSGPSNPRSRVEVGLGSFNPKSSVQSMSAGNWVMGAEGPYGAHYKSCLKFMRGKYSIPM